MIRGKFKNKYQCSMMAPCCSISWKILFFPTIFWMKLKDCFCMIKNPLVAVVTEKLKIMHYDFHIMLTKLKIDLSLLIGTSTFHKLERWLWILFNLRMTITRTDASYSWSFHFNSTSSCLLYGSNFKLAKPNCIYSVRFSLIERFY